MPNKRRRLQGVVVSDKMDKTIVVQVETIKRHPLYIKIVRSYKKYMAHDETNQAKIGDLVQIVESQPLSKRKRWALETVLSEAVVSAPLVEEETHDSN